MLKRWVFKGTTEGRMRVSESYVESYLIYIYL